MGPPTACEQCGKKLSVFSKRRKCVHCMAAVCKHCYTPHLVARHPSAAAAAAAAAAADHDGRRSRRRHATNTTPHLEVSDNTSDDDVYFLSPVHAQARRGFRDSMLDGVDAVDVASGDEDDDHDDDNDDVDDDDDEDDDDGVEDEDDEEDDEEDGVGDDIADSYTRPARRMSVEEEHDQHKELVRLQDAVATWARKEAAAERAQRVAKRTSCYSMTPVTNVRVTREYQERACFASSYAVVVTLLVWGVYAGAYLLYARVRGEFVRLAV